MTAPSTVTFSQEFEVPIAGSEPIGYQPCRWTVPTRTIPISLPTLKQTTEWCSPTIGGFSPEHPSGVLDTICTILNEQSLNLRYILQTHSYYDHVGNTQYLTDCCDATVCAHPDEQAILEDPSLLTQPRYIESMGSDLAQITWDLSVKNPAVLLPSPESVEHRRTPAVEIDRTINQGDVLAIGELNSTCYTR